MSDAEDVYNCITLPMTRYMFWEPPPSLAAYKARREAVLQARDRSGFSFVIRRLEGMECLGIASLDHADASSPELGVWLKESEHGSGYGGEAVRAVVAWAFEVLGKGSFVYAAATQNIPSRRLAERLGGEIIGTRTSPKYDYVIYRISWNARARSSG